MLIRSVVISALFYIVLAGSAGAHSKMAKSFPAEGATAKIGLSQIQLGFSQPVRVVLVKVKNADNKSDVKTEFKPAKAFKTSFPFQVAPLAAGSHEVTWTAVAQDGHVMKGTLTFKIAK